MTWSLKIQYTALAFAWGLIWAYSCYNCLQRCNRFEYLKAFAKKLGIFCLPGVAQSICRDITPPAKTKLSK